MKRFDAIGIVDGKINIYGVDMDWLKAVIDDDIEKLECLGDYLNRKEEAEKGMRLAEELSALFETAIEACTAK